MGRRGGLGGKRERAYGGFGRGRPVDKKELDVEVEGQETVMDDGFRVVEEEIGGEGEETGREDGNKVSDWLAGEWAYVELTDVKHGTVWVEATVWMTGEEEGVERQEEKTVEVAREAEGTVAVMEGGIVDWWTLKDEDAEGRELDDWEKVDDKFAEGLRGLDDWAIVQGVGAEWGLIVESCDIRGTSSDRKEDGRVDSDFAKSEQNFLEIQESSDVRWATLETDDLTQCGQTKGYVAAR